MPWPEIYSGRNCAKNFPSSMRWKSCLRQTKVANTTTEWTPCYSRGEFFFAVLSSVVAPCGVSVPLLWPLITAPPPPPCCLKAASFLLSPFFPALGTFYYAPFHSTEGIHLEKSYDMMSMLIIMHKHRVEWTKCVTCQLVSWFLFYSCSWFTHLNLSPCRQLGQDKKIGTT